MVKRPSEKKRTLRNIWGSLLLVLVIYLISYAFYVISFRNENQEYYALNGTVDVTGYDFYTDPAPLHMRGDWFFYPGEFLSTEDVLSRPAPGVMNVPGRFTKSGYDAFGYGTYHLRMTVDESAPEVLYLKIPIIQHASKLWVDGSLIFEAGEPGESVEADEPGIAVTIAAFARKGETIDFVAWVSNYRYYKSGFSNPMELGRREVVVYPNIQRWLIVTLVLGGMLFIGLFNIGIYFFRSKERINLYFGLMCVFHFTRYAFGFMDVDGFLFAGWNELVKNVISMVSLYLITYYMARFTLCLLEVERRGFIWILRAVTAVSVIISQLIPFSSAMIDAFQAANRTATIAITAYLMLEIVLALPRLKNDARIVFAFAYVAYGLFAIIEAAYSITLRMPSFPAGLALIAAQCIVLASSYGKALTAVERANLELEDRVAKRTEELRDAYAQVAASEQYLKDMVGNISHDLKTPLTVVGLNLERLTDGERPRTEAETRRYASVAYNKTLDLQRLTRNLFEAVRMEGAGAVYKSEWVKLSALFPEVYRRYTEYVESAGVTLAVRYGEDREIWADTEKLWGLSDA